MCAAPRVLFRLPFRGCVYFSLFRHKHKELISTRNCVTAARKNSSFFARVLVERILFTCLRAAESSHRGAIRHSCVALSPLPTLPSPIGSLLICDNAFVVSERASERPGELCNIATYRKTICYRRAISRVNKVTRVRVWAGAGSPPL